MAAGQEVIFQDGFESGNLTAWSSSATDGSDLAVAGFAALDGSSFGLRALVDDVTPIFVRDDTPASESRYQVRFHVDPNGFDPGEAANHLRTRIVLVQDAANARLVAIVLRRREGVFAVMARVRLDDGTRADTGFFTISDSPHEIAFDWKRSSSEGADDGSFELTVDGASQSLLTGLDNDVSGADYVRMGALSVKAGAAGELYFDGFVSERPSSCLDTDGDGWTTCQGDCCDAAGLCPGADPVLVNPGAFDVAGNGVDDDCDAATPDSGPIACDGGLASSSSAPLDYARALDLCSSTVESPPLEQRRWGVITGAFSLADGTGAPAAGSRAIRTTFGSVGPLSGTAFTVLSSGTAAAPGQVLPSHGPPQPGQEMGTTSGPPADWLTAHLGVPPVAPGCPAAFNAVAQDPIQLKLRVRVPTNARSFSLRAFAYSSEYPEWVCGMFMDYVVVLFDSQFTPTGGESANPADKNLASFDPPPAGGEVVPFGGHLAWGNTGAFTQCLNGAIGCASGNAGVMAACVGTSQLAGTGFDLLVAGSDACGANNQVGGGTGWLTIRGNVQPGETIELRFAVWDTGDTLYDSLVLLDGFEWSTTSIVPGTTP
jgi:hypothetical protein